MAPSIDQDVLDRFRLGDDAAVGTLYRVYGRLVFTVANRVLCNRSLAEEATQQTFVQAWRGSASFEPGRDPAPWLATIARRVAIDVQRREARRPSEPLDQAAADEPGMIVPAPSADQLWTTWEIRRAIDGLDAAEREVVRLQHLQGFTHQEISDRLRVPLGTVKSRSFRAHRTLAKQLAHLHEPVDES